MIKYILISVIIFFSSVTYSQIPCIDEIRKSATYQCDEPIYQPVCGCDLKTYRNQCVAYNNAGVNNFTSGVCTGLDFDFYPNPSTQNIPFTCNLQFKEFTTGNITLQVIDFYGKVVFQRIINNFNYFQLQVDPSNFRNGIYHFVIVSNTGQVIIKKFSRI